MAEAAGFEQGRRQVGRQVILRAPAKVNLHLEVVRQRHDGYHDIETVLQAVRIYDRVAVTLSEEYPGGEPRIALKVSGAANVPADESNLCWRAARHFCRETGCSGSLSIDLAKEIPVGAGLGGGSSDAAAVLVACNDLFGKKLPPEALEQLGATLGADVPFFVRGGTAMGRGIGTELTPLPRVGHCRFVIVKSGLHLKTPDVYGELKMGLTVNSAKANIGVIRSQLVRFPQESWPGFNRLEDVVLPSQPSIQRLVYRMRELAPVAMLCGSGAAVYGAFQAREDLSDVTEEFRAAGLYVQAVEPHAGGVEMMPGSG